MPRSQQSRRSFLTRSSAVLAAATASAAFPWSAKAFANTMAVDRPRVGCIGLGGMGRGDAHGHRSFGDIIALCDVDESQAAKANEDPNIGAGKADLCTDYRKVLERPDIDVVSIVTPDHWHVKIAIEALIAGKHVFCQKPLTLTLEENQLIRNACRKYSDRVFFIGTQQRSDQERFLRAVNMVRRGLIGDVQKVTVGINGGDVGGPFQKSDPPANLNWDMWLGQAPKVDYIKERCHNTVRWWYEYSGGKFTDWGAHHVDISLWAAGLDQEGTGPVEVDGTDAKHPVPFKDGYPEQDDRFNSAHDFNVIAKFAGGMEMHITSRGDNGILFEGSKGRFFVNRGKITGQPIEENWDKDQFGPEQLQELYKGKPFEGHKNNFYRCLAEGGLPVSDVYSHVQTMNTCHLAVIAARLNRVIKWDAKAEKITGDDQAASFFARTPRAGFEIARV